MDAARPATRISVPLATTEHQRPLSTRATVLGSPKAGLLREMNNGDSTRTGSDKASTSQTEPQASSAAAAETNDIGELEVEDDEEDKDK